MEERHRCKLCMKSFGSGRALGGHMRSHFMKLPVMNLQEEEGEEEQPPPMYDVQSYSSTSSSSSEEEEGEIKDDDDDDDVKSYELEGGDDEGSMFPLQDRESETESPRRRRRRTISRIGTGRPVFRRSKRVRKSRISDFNGFGINAFFQAKKPESVAAAAKGDDLLCENSSVMETEAPLSSISDTTPEEHVAHCLIMLSRDKWTRQDQSDDHQEEEVTTTMMAAKSSGKRSSSSSSKKVKGKYRCETCSKLFRSYQALGGHRASHNKVKVNAAAPEDRNGKQEKTHQCPFCHRIFPSGQALGGHKRSHFAIGGSASSSSAAAAVIKSNGEKIGEIILGIDLNLPPVPTTDDEEDENSQVDVSAVSDAEFVHTSKVN